MPRACLALTAALTVAFTSDAAGEQTVASLALAPVSAWTADYAVDSCALRRRFGDGAETVVFEISQAGPESAIEIRVASATLSFSNRAPRTGFLPGDTPKEAQAYQALLTVDGLKGFALYDTIRLSQDLRSNSAGDASWSDADRDEREREITGYAIERAFDRDLVILTGSLHAPMTAMRACLDDLASQWGLDPATQRTLSRRAEVDFGDGWVSRVAQVQRRLISDRNRANVRARLLVDETGLVTGCRLLNLPAESDDAAEFCGEMERRARLTPALDSGGKPVKSFYIWDMTMVMRTSVTAIQ